MTNGPCPICTETASIHSLYQGRNVRFVECRLCGRYIISNMLAGGIRSDDNRALLPYLSAHLRQATERDHLVEITTDNWRALAEGHATIPVTTKLERVLEYFGRKSKHPGAEVVADMPWDVPLFDAASESEVFYYIDALARRHLLDGAGMSGVQRQFVVTPEGWQKLAPSDPGGVPGTCFVAMAFDPSLDEVFETAIEPAANACGFRVIRVDELQHNGVVTDVIIAEIRRARIVVADVTLQRRGVYFEAGFALGLGRVVIWTCHADDLANVHFDTRQYNHVVWSTAAELRTGLEARIRATVATGP